jgi:hypothetical protein
MKKLSFIFSLFVLLIACSKKSDLSVMPGEETATQAYGVAQLVARAFKGNFVTSIDQDPSNSPLVCSGDVPGFAIPGRLLLQGNAIHLGEVVWQQSTLQHVSCNLSVAAMQLTATVNGQITASNGDHIYYAGNDIIDVTNLLTQQGTTGTIQGTWTITGGTGRFAGASGSLTISGPVDFITTTVKIAAEGTISY